MFKTLEYDFAILIMLRRIFWNRPPPNIRDKFCDRGRISSIQLGENSKGMSGRTGVGRLINDPDERQFDKSQVTYEVLG